MKLYCIAERRKSPRMIRMFHGSGYPISSFNAGLIPSPPNKGGGNFDSSAVFLTPDIKLALFYGKSIVEVMVNSNTTQLVADEEQFPLGEIPSSYDDEREWKIFWNWFDKLITPPNDVEREIFMKAYEKAHERSKTTGYVDQWDNAFADAARRIFARRNIKPCGDEGWAGNMMLMTTQPITFKGRNKIVGMYEFENRRVNSDYAKAICTRVVYSNGGSISLGDEFRPAVDWTG